MTGGVVAALVTLFVAALAPAASAQDAPAYGATWQRHGFSCKSEPSGVTCVNPKGHGFELSRSGQRVF